LILKYRNQSILDLKVGLFWNIWGVWEQRGAKKQNAYPSLKQIPIKKCNKKCMRLWGSMKKIVYGDN
jgi:hypothetical protein